MDIVRIHYARLRNLGNFENERVELEAQLWPEENVHSVYLFLRDLADELLFPERRSPPAPLAAQRDDPPF